MCTVSGDSDSVNCPVDNLRCFGDGIVGGVGGLGLISLIVLMNFSESFDLQKHHLWVAVMMV